MISWLVYLHKLRISCCWSEVIDKAAAGQDLNWIVRCTRYLCLAVAVMLQQKSRTARITLIIRAS